MTEEKIGFSYLKSDFLKTSNLKKNWNGVKKFSNKTKISLEDVRDMEKLDMEKFCCTTSMKKNLYSLAYVGRFQNLLI